MGPNGAGKTTLAKLLCRLYDIEAGEVLLGGADVRTLRRDELRGAIAVLAQHPMQYNATVRENVAYGDIERRPDDAAILRAVGVAGAEPIIAELPNGLGNMLGRSFASGAELSGGEWQRIAAARSFLRRARVLILDEPTSAMDPWSERDWAARLREFAAGRTVILITHRLTTAMAADTVCVMERGAVVQQGSPDELREQAEGPYARAWRSRT